MKLRPLLIAAAALWVGGTSVHAATPPTVIADRTVLWSVRFDAERLRSGVGQTLFANLDPILTVLSGEKSSLPGGKLESVAVYGFQPPKNAGHDFPLLADLTFTTDNGGISRRFDAVGRKHNAPVETVAGYPAIHFDHEGREVWIGKFSDARVVVSTSRDLLEPALLAGAKGFATVASAKPNEMLGGNVEISSLLATNPILGKSELLNLLPHLDFHVLSDGARFDLDASAELDSDRSARRAARMIDGMVAALSIQDTGGVPWDERLALQQDGARLGMKLHLEPQEAQKLLDGFVHEIQQGVKAHAGHAKPHAEAAKEEDDSDDE